MAVYNDNVRFSSCTAVTGPFPGFPVPLEGDDISDLIAAHRDELPFNDQLPTLDPPLHTDHRALLSKMITPKRLKENEEFMWCLADRQFDEALAGGRCEFVADFGNPFAMLVIADLLGVPESDHNDFKDQLLTSTGTIGSSDGDAMHHSPLEYLYGKFTEYITDRRERPRDDVLTGLASALFPDGRDPTGDRCGVRGGQFVRGRAGDHGPPAQHRGDDDRRRFCATGEVACRPQSDSGLRRGGAAGRESDPRRLPAGQGAGRRRRGGAACGHDGDAEQRGGQP